jgi:hypothetical protein
MSPGWVGSGRMTRRQWSCCGGLYGWMELWSEAEPGAGSGADQTPPPLGGSLWRIGSPTHRECTQKCPSAEGNAESGSPSATGEFLWCGYPVSGR